MTKEYFKEPVKVVRLWVHECERVLMDRMVSDTDMLKFGDFRINITKKHFDDVPQVRIAASLVLELTVLTCSSMRNTDKFAVHMSGDANASISLLFSGSTHAASQW